MKIKIYQIATDRDKNNVKFMSLEDLIKYQGSEKIDETLYTEVFSGETEGRNLEDIYEEFNLKIQPLNRGHSLSISDMVVTEEGAYYCDRIGYEKIAFDETRAEKPQNLLKVVYVEPNKRPYVAEIENTLRQLQRAVGGNIELVHNGDGTGIVCNEEGKLNNLPGNRKVGSDIIVGNFYIVGLTSDDFRSLTEAETDKYMERFSEPEEITPEEVENSIRIDFYTLK